MTKLTNFELVQQMNVAFGNRMGDARDIDWTRVRKQCLNITDELGELFIALGADEASIKHLTAALKWTADHVVNPVNVTQTRDSLGDIHVFAYGANHLMGVDADRDMVSIIDGVMTRFVKDDEDLRLTMDKHAAKGVTNVYTEGEFPTMILKSLIDQPDAPQGKFLKSASYVEPVFYALPAPVVREPVEPTEGSTTIKPTAQMSDREWAALPAGQREHTTTHVPGVGSL